MKISFPEILLVLVAMTTQVTAQAPPTSRSLEGLVMEFVRRSLADAQQIFNDISPRLKNLDWSNGNASSNALKTVPCNLLCNVCWKWEPKLACSQCENHCEARCRWNFKTTQDNARLSRGLFDICLGFPGGPRFSFGGLGQLLGNIPLLGSLVGK